MFEHIKIIFAPKYKTNLLQHYIKIMRFTGSSVSRSILGMPTFRESYNPLHQGEEQPDTDLHSFYITLLVGMVGKKKKIVGEVRGRERWGKLVSL